MERFGQQPDAAPLAEDVHRHAIARFEGGCVDAGRGQAHDLMAVGARGLSGQVRNQLKTSYRDGTTHIVLKPLDLMALVPLPRGAGTAAPALNSIRRGFQAAGFARCSAPVGACSRT